MRERAKMLNGTFKIESAPGAGTQIMVVIPIFFEPQIEKETRP